MFKRCHECHEGLCDTLGLQKLVDMEPPNPAYRPNTSGVKPKPKPKKINEDEDDRRPSKRPRSEPPSGHKDGNKVVEVVAEGEKEIDT